MNDLLLAADSAESKVLRFLRSRHVVYDQVEDGIDLLLDFLENTDELAPYIAGLQRLAGFSCERSDFSDEAFSQLSGHSSLRRVRILNSQITGEGMHVLPTLPQLWELSCSPRIQVETGMAFVGESSNLRSLNLGYADLSDEALSPLRMLRQLEELDLVGNPVSEGVSVVEHLAQLKSIGLEHTFVGDKDLNSVIKCRDLCKLHLSNTKVTDDGMRLIPLLLKLETLGISDTAVGINGLKQVSGMPSLQTLFIHGIEMDHDVVQLLSEMRQLRVLFATEALIEPNLKQDLEQQLPKCEFNWATEEEID